MRDDIRPFAVVIRGTTMSTSKIESIVESITEEVKSKFTRTIGLVGVIDIDEFFQFIETTSDE